MLTTLKASQNNLKTIFKNLKDKFVQIHFQRDDVSVVSNVHCFVGGHHRRCRLHLRALQQRQQPQSDLGQLSSAHFRSHGRTLDRDHLPQEPALGETREVHLAGQRHRVCAAHRFGHDLQYFKSELFRGGDTVENNLQLCQLQHVTFCSLKVIPSFILLRISLDL